METVTFVRYLANGKCGVNEYSRLISRELNLYAESKVVEYSTFKELLIGLWRNKSKVLLLQYPMLSWRTSVEPIIIGWLWKLIFNKKVILVIHEFSEAHYLRRKIISALILIADRIICTTHNEAMSIGVEVVVIPVPSLISPNPPISTDTRPFSIVYFGALSVGKGLEVFLEATQPFSSTPICVVGGLVEAQEKWFYKLMDNYGNVDTLLNASDQVVSDTLRTFDIAVMPFSDGVSERRSTFVCALEHGLKVITSCGEYTTAELRCLEEVHFVSENEQDQYIELINTLRGDRGHDCLKSSPFRTQFLEKRQLSIIVTAYLAIINSECSEL